ncbi:probable cytochrome P450 313a4 isoform X2 [Wyeomyia smithii]|uniref:probable cytochrome P450 313a4 isoform X2 n=1 Tax=Wyeomyia smithii TaxID=174621 RepID=UPI0024681ADF|nr:probable cytochrome P450 313a4 isoform X2 [Wyeomyia smithii]
MIAEILVLVLIVVSVKYYANFRRHMSFAKDLHTVQPCYPIIGNIMKILWKNDEDRFHGLMEGFRHPSKLFKFWLAFIPLLTTNDPGMIQKILTHPQCMQKPYIYKLIESKFGLLVADDPIWKRQRKALNPTFNLKVLNGFIPVFDKHAQSLVNELFQKPIGKKVQFTEMVTRCTLGMVCATTIGLNIYEDANMDRIPHLFDKFFRFTTLNQINKTKLQVFQDAKIQRAKREDANSDGYRKPNIFIDQLLDLHYKKIFNDIEVSDNVTTMIMAGSDTSGTELGIIAQLLAMYPHLQDKVYQEIRRVFPTNDELHFTLENLGQLQYMEKFIKEALRLFPIAPVILRQATSDVVLDGLRIPSGTILTVCIYNLHRRKDIWGPDAEEFNPENFTPERIKSRHPFAYLPFSGGNRNCIGYRYGMISMKIIVVHLLLNFKLKSDLTCHRELRVKFNTLLKLSVEPGLVLEHRNDQF